MYSHAVYLLWCHSLEDCSSMQAYESKIYFSYSIKTPNKHWLGFVHAVDVIENIKNTHTLSQELKVIKKQYQF